MVIPKRKEAPMRERDRLLAIIAIAAALAMAAAGYLLDAALAGSGLPSWLKVLLLAR